MHAQSGRSIYVHVLSLLPSAEEEAHLNASASLPAAARLARPPHTCKRMRPNCIHRSYGGHQLHWTPEHNAQDIQVKCTGLPHRFLRSSFRFASRHSFVACSFFVCSCEEAAKRRTGCAHLRLFLHSRLSEGGLGATSKTNTVKDKSADGCRRTPQVQAISFA